MGLGRDLEGNMLPVDYPIFPFETLAEVRRGKLALRVLQHILWEGGIQLDPSQLKEMAQAIGVPSKELVQFAEGIVREMRNEHPW